MEKLVLENGDNEVARVFRWDGNAAYVICREDSRRIELHSELTLLDNNKIGYKQLAVIDPVKIHKHPVSIGKNVTLRLVKDVENTEAAPELSKDSNRLLYIVAAVLLLLNFGFMGLMNSLPENNEALNEELKQQVVQIVKKMQPKDIQKVQMVKQNTATVKVDTNKKFNGIKRLGALAVLGSLNKSNQKGGLNLNAVNTTAGPGLGGTGGSGGVQTSIYGKGITSAPLGAGQNVAGGGGYGTKGKGGGQAGYGKLSMVGSAGNMPVPLGREALIEGGLDLDMVSAVIRRNMGQIRFCYEQGLQLDPAVAGRVGVRFVIGPNGQVKLADVENTTLNSKQIEECVLLRLKSWKFPLPDGGVDVKVSYPFSFKRTGNG
jgi:hypothetical protein